MRFSLLWLLAAPLPAAGFAQTGTLIYSTNPQDPPSDWVADQAAFDGASIELLSPVLPPGIKGHLGGVSLGDTFGGGFDDDRPAVLEVETAGSTVENFRKLSTGRIDWFVSGKNLGQAYLATLEPEISRRLAELDKAHVPEQLLEKHLRRLVTLPPGSFPGE